MTENDDRFDEPDFDDPAHAGIRDLLASARTDQPIPADVAARLDATLAELTGRASAPADEPGPRVVPFRRRSKVGPRLLAAAAVIVVAGAGAVGLNQVVQNSSSDDASAGSATAAQDNDSITGPELATPHAPSLQDGNLVNELDSPATKSLQMARAARVPVLTTSDFSDQAAALKVGRLTVLSKSALDSRATADATGRIPTPLSSSPSESGKGFSTTTGGAFAPSTAAALKARTCTPPKIDGTTSYPIVLDGQPAVLVVGPVNAGTRLVEAWNCAGNKVLAIAAIPA